MQNLNTLFSDLQAAETVWLAELATAFPGQDVRYSSLSTGAPGSAINAAYVRFVEASQTVRLAVAAA